MAKSKKAKGRSGKRLFRAQKDQDEMFEKSIEQEVEEAKTTKVECLGMVFDNDEERRKYFTEKLREKLKDPEFRKIEGFPVGLDEDMLALSDPPYYTACPNPFIVDFIKQYGRPYDPKENYHREPYAFDVSEGKNDPLYNVHGYHTKVPHKAIMRYVLHYTDPGDFVFDGFCGTGMTAIAARSCGDKKAIKGIGLTTKDDDEIVDAAGAHISTFGDRLPIVSDLSPIAVSIADGINSKDFSINVSRQMARALEQAEKECRWMYETLHIDGKTKCRVAAFVWSDYVTCSECSTEFLYWDVAVDNKSGEVLDSFRCPHCDFVLTKRKTNRSYSTILDQSLGKNVAQVKQKLVQIDYMLGKKKLTKQPDHHDYELVARIEGQRIPFWHPMDPIPAGDKTNEALRLGLKHIHHFYTKRVLWALASLLDKLPDESVPRLWFTSQLLNLSKLNRFRPDVSFPYNPMSGTIYIASQTVEANPFIAYHNKIRRMLLGLSKLPGHAIVECVSLTKSSLPDSSVDYIFTDPPFGGNLMYSELNMLCESWIRVKTNNKHEAIENITQAKGIIEYQMLMTECFVQYFRILKPGHWMTVEFHNSRNAVWNSIQEALQIAGFVVGDVRSIDKQQGTFNQVTTAGAVKQDLIISVYKPNGGLEDRFKTEAGTGEGVWDFIRTHLKQLPVFVSREGIVEIVAERQAFLLFDRMIAFHVQRGVRVPESASEFYVGLSQRLPERDGMYFLPDQVAEYDKKRLRARGLVQLELFVKDESSAILWLQRQLQEKPQTFQEIHPQFMREISGWEKYEKPLELRELLEQNFLSYDGEEEVPNPIHSYLSSNFKELRKLAKDHASLRAKGKDRWYLPDLNKTGDLEKIREKALLKEFWEYLPAGYVPKKTELLDGQLSLLEQKKRRDIPTGKKLRIIRTEAARAGFKYCWQNKDYETIIAVANRIPENVLQEDAKLLMWYDQARTRLGENG